LRPAIDHLVGPGGSGKTRLALASPRISRGTIATGRGSWCSRA
jgi:hypothetical protein